MTTVVIADDHPVVLIGLRGALEEEGDFRLVGEAGDGLEVVRLAAELQPDLLLTDYMMPGMNGAEVARQVGRRSPHTRVVVVSMHSVLSYALESLRAGAMAYVLKGSGTADMVAAARSALAGKRYLSPPLVDQLVRAHLEKLNSEDQSPYHTLTTRERQVLHLAAEGRTDDDVAERLGLTRCTVAMHRSHLMRKLGLQSRAELVRYAVERGLAGLCPAGHHDMEADCVLDDGRETYSSEEPGTSGPGA